MVFILYKLYVLLSYTYPTPKLSPHRRRCISTFPPKNIFISILNYGDTENVLINHLLLVIPMSHPCHYTNLCPHKPHKHAHTHTHTHTHTKKIQHSCFSPYIMIYNGVQNGRLIDLFYSMDKKYLTLSVTFIIRRIVFKAANQHIRIISTGSCDTGDWSNGCFLIK